MPLLRIVFECLYVGAFPMAVLLMLTPAGATIFRSYVTGLIWLQSWGPLYAVLHRISMGEAAERMQATALMPDGDIGISLVAQAGIRAVASDVAVMSGYLSMSVPFLAAALAYGLSKATVLATSVLAVGQDAASSAAHEGTTGNLSLANTGYDTHRFATLEGRQIRTSAHVDTDRYTGYAPAGAGMTVTGDGTVVADAGAATSRIPAAGVRLSESLATSHEERAAQARGLSRHWSAEAGQARNAAVTDATGMIERYSHDVSTGEAFARGVTESESSQVQQLDSHVEKLAEIAGISKNQVATLTGQASVGGGWDFIVKAKADGSVMWRGQTIESDAWNRVKEYDRQHGVTETWSQVADASRRYSTQTGDSEMASLDESLSANLTRMRSFQERASLARQESESWSEQASQVRSDAQAIERELGQPFFAWLSEQRGTDGRAIGAAGAMRIASPQTAEDSEQLREYAAAFIAEKSPAPAGPDPSSVGGAAEYEGATGKLREAYAGETAAAHAGWSAGVRDRADGAGAPRPGQTEAQARNERVETKTDMVMKGTAREARQTVTGQETAEGRAGVAVETNKPFEQHATENLPVVGDWLAGNLFGSAGAMRLASPQTAEDSEQLREYAAAFIAEKYPAPAGPDPSSVGGAAEYEGATGKLREAYAGETAAAHAGWSAGVRDRADGAGAPRPGQTEAQARNERVETKTEMTMKETAREARQTVTGQETAEGRAGVAVETNKPF
ncbi:MAG: conjugal transfer protein TraG N-terminal domain-containing protein, partial [Defluviicoccus sp.]|nr:conjugal transfer protein TraG N-terminal domain-containing protein [Defluviicoccus sp.]